MRLLRWLVFLPAGLLLGLFWYFFIFIFGDAFAGDSPVFSGIVIALAFSTPPFLIVYVGCLVAPAKKALVKWLMLLPLAIFAVDRTFELYILFSTDVDLPADLTEEAFENLSSWWKIVLTDAGFILGTLASALYPAHWLED